MGHRDTAPSPGWALSSQGPVGSGLEFELFLSSVSEDSQSASSLAQLPPGSLAGCPAAR